jgi:hypothetical protein
MSELFSIVLVHVGGDRRSVPVEHIANTYVSVRWGQSGIYDLNLAKNVLTARSQKAQRKGKAHWKAEDIHAVRKMVEHYFREKRGNLQREALENDKKHVENMPQYNRPVPDDCA